MDDQLEAVVRGEGIVKTFKDFWGRDKVKALRGVDIVIPKGSVFGLLGPNGAGKSTLIKLILGHLYPSSGRLSVLGKDPKDVDIKFKIGYLPERSYLYKNLTAEETLYYFGEILNLSKDQIKSRTDQLLEMVGLQNAKKRYVGEFSHGMTRRMGMAQALLNDPDFIILDEPTAGLDPVGCREVKDLIITLGKRGKTVLLTSHLLADVEDTCDQIMMMYGGTVQSHGHVDDLLADTNRIKVEFPANCGVDIEAFQKDLALKAGKDFLVSSPKQSLEQYFLNIVTKGNETQETAGAQQGAGVAEYLKAGIAPVKQEAKEEDIEKKAPKTVEVPKVVETPEAVEVPKVVESPEAVEVPKVVEAPKSLESSPSGSTVVEEELLATSEPSVEDELKKPAVVDSTISEISEKQETSLEVELTETAPASKSTHEAASEAAEELKVEEEPQADKNTLDILKASSQTEEELSLDRHVEDDDEDEDLDEDLLDKLTL